MKIKIRAGRHQRILCPLCVDCPPTLPSSLILRDIETGVSFPAQVGQQGNGTKLFFILPLLPKGEEKIYEVVEGETKEGVNVVENGEKVDVKIGEELFTTYNIGPELPRPFFYPLNGPSNIPMTRNFPMKDVPGERKDHPHHRSLWVAYGDVNGVDNWSEEGRYGRQIHRRLRNVVSGPVYGFFESVVDWVDGEGKKVLTEVRRVTFYNISSPLRMMDFQISFFATEGDVLFGDTKEGGIISVRVASQLEEMQGGKIENSYGALGEEEAWGRRAHWCDYSGRIEGENVGIAIFDNPRNLRYPTYWHVRGYGLFTANPFGVSHFTGDHQNRGDYRLLEGSALTFSYRLILHRGDAQEAGIKDHFLNYIYPPQVEVCE